MTTQESIIDILRTELGLEESLPITPETTLAELGADSLDTVELVTAIEEEFDVSIDDEAIADCRTVGDVFKLIEGKEGA